MYQKNKKYKEKYKKKLSEIRKKRSTNRFRKMSGENSTRQNNPARVYIESHE